MLWRLLACWLCRMWGGGGWDFTLDSHTIPLLQPKKVTGFCFFLAVFPTAGFVAWIVKIGIWCSTSSCSLLQHCKYAQEKEEGLPRWKLVEVQCRGPLLRPLCVYSQYVYPACWSLLYASTEMPSPGQQYQLLPLSFEEAFLQPMKDATQGEREGVGRMYSLIHPHRTNHTLALCFISHCP